ASWHGSMSGSPSVRTAATRSIRRSRSESGHPASLRFQGGRRGADAFSRAAILLSSARGRIRTATCFRLGWRAIVFARTEGGAAFGHRGGAAQDLPAPAAMVVAPVRTKAGLRFRRRHLLQQRRLVLAYADA